MRSIIRRLPAIGLAVSLLLTAPTGAAAAGPPAVPTWPAVRCATGTMTAYVAAPQDVWVSGWIQPCPETPDRTVADFSVVYYMPAYAVRGRQLSYEGMDVPTPFGGMLYHYADLAAVCLAFSPTGRLACLAVEQTAGGFTVTPIGTDDPRVALPVSPAAGGPGEEGPGTTCGNCV